MFDRVLKVKNFQNLIDLEEETIKPKNTPVADLVTDFSSYYRLESIYKWLDFLTEKHASVVSSIHLGTTYEGNSIRALKISKSSNKYGVVVEALIHGREWVSTSTALYIINELIYSTGLHYIYLQLQTKKFKRFSTNRSLHD